MKSMKKSMFVTTILMVVLLIVALSTATFAWYTQNTTTSAVSTSITSASSSSASLVIDSQIASQNDNNSSVYLTMYGTNDPMVYTSDSAVSLNTAYGTFIGAFKKFTSDNGGHFGSAVQPASPAVITASTGVGRTDGSGTPSDVIVLTNVGGNSITTINATVTFDANAYKAVQTNVEADFATYYVLNNGQYTLASAGGGEYSAQGHYYVQETSLAHLRVAVFACPTNVVTGAEGHTMSDELKLKGVFAADTIQRASATGLGGEITVGTTVISETVGNATINADLATALGAEPAVSAVKASGVALPIAASVPAYGTAGNSIYVKVVAWFEGQDMHNADANRAAAFSISFTAA